MTNVIKNIDKTIKAIKIWEYSLKEENGLDDFSKSVRRELLKEKTTKLEQILLSNKGKITKNKAIMLSVVQNARLTEKVWNRISPEFKDDKKFMLTAVKKDHRAIEFASDELKMDYELVQASCSEKYMIILEKKQLKEKVANLKEKIAFLKYNKEWLKETLKEIKDHEKHYSNDDIMYLKNIATTLESIVAREESNIAYEEKEIVAYKTKVPESDYNSCIKVLSSKPSVLAMIKGFQNCLKSRDMDKSEPSQSKRTDLEL